MRAVRGVRWDEVYHGLDSEETGWRTWKEEYEPDAGIVNFYQTKVRARGIPLVVLLTQLPRTRLWRTLTVRSSVQLLH